MEEWRDIKGYEGLYQISNEGRVKSLSRIIKYKDGRDRPTKEKILKQTKDNNGYYYINLSKDSKIKPYRVHVLLYSTFVSEIPKGYVIDHINRNKSDNRLENLRMVSYNINSLNREFKYKPDIYKYKNKKGKKIYYVLRFSFDGKRKTIGYYDTYEDAEKVYGELFKIREEKYNNINVE